MILFFNIELLEKQTTNPIKFIQVLEHYYNVKYLKKYYYKYIDLKGNSYLLNPEPLFRVNIDKSYIVQYIKLAARRDYGLYKLYKVKTLDISYFPEINLEAIKHNPLLTIINNKIYFKFEEINYGPKFWSNAR